MDWDALAQSAATCQACGLCVGRKQSTLYVPATAVQADWMVVGDPPDEDEDRLGQPFAEQAGVLLDNMLKAVGVSRTGQARRKSSSIWVNVTDSARRSSDARTMRSRVVSTDSRPRQPRTASTAISDTAMSSSSSVKPASPRALRSSSLMADWY